MDELRRAGLQVAQRYDVLPYETPDDPNLHPRALLGFGGVFGCVGAGGDVLDLGCGTGVQLAAAGGEMPGRLLGVDLSEGNCTAARARLAPYGERAHIQCADLLDLTPQGLGQFDLIYAVGVIFALPEPVRHHALDLIGACLKPGGVALITHYGGAMSALRASLHRTLRAALAPDLPPPEAVTQARAWLAQTAQRLEPTHPMHEAARLTASLPDATFFHEVFNPWNAPLPVAELDRRLAAADVRFLGHVEAPASGFGPDPARRAQDADTADLGGGGYHHALFGRHTHASDLTAPGIVWSTVLQPMAGEQFRVSGGGRPIQIGHAPTRRTLERIAHAPQPILQAAPEEERSVTLRVLRDLWAHRLVMPLRA